MPAGSALAGRTLLVVLAHPDDEALACGGTLARAADAGVRIVLLCASRGERGSISDPALVPDGDLGRVRTRELQEAAAVLGIAEVQVLDYPDGNLRWAENPPLSADILAAIGRHHPDAVITFGEDGLYWHPDHIGIYEWTTAAIRSLGRDRPLLYYVTMPQGVMREVVEAAHRKGATDAAFTFWGITPEAFGYSAAPPTIVVDVRDEVARKLAALKCHRTQMGPHNPLAWIGEEEARRWLGVEQFRRAPFEATAEPLLEQLGREAEGVLHA